MNLKMLFRSLRCESPAGACSWARLTKGLAVAFLVTVWSGCSSEPGAPGPQNAKAAAGSTTLIPESTTRSAAVSPKSVFAFGSKAGRDPFFPDSTRSATKVATAASAPRAVATSLLKLVGIRPGTQRPMALINRTPIAAGEEGEVTIVSPNPSGKPLVQKVSIRCIEIRRDSVLIQVAGETGIKELRMTQGK